MAYTAAWHPNDQSSNVTTCAPLSISPLSSLIDNLIKSWIDIIRELYFRDGLHPLGCTAYCETHNTLFTQWSIEYSLWTEIPMKSHSAAKNATKSDIFAEY